MDEPVLFAILSIMSQEERELLEDTYRLVKETNSLVRKMRSIQRTRNWLTVFYWLFVFGLAFGAFVFIKPLVDAIGSLGGVESLSESIKNLILPR